MDIGELDTTRRRSSKVDGDKGGKKMKRSNSSSKSQSKSKQNNQDNDNSDLDEIDISIPDYYKNNNAAASVSQKKIECSPDEWIEEGVLRSETQHSFFEKDTKAESSEEDQDDTPTDKQSKIAHTKFISALERHGSSERAFHNIAEELDWSIEDTKVYAYSYFKALIRERRRKIYKDIGSTTNAKNKETTTSTATTDTDNWSFHEHILLDALMVKHCKDSSCLNDEKGSSKTWDHIAYQLPGRTAQQCKTEGIRRSGHC